MALYLGSSEKLKIYLDGVAYRLNLPTIISNTNGIRLLSSDNYILTDSNGLYLITPIRLLSSDNYILTDSNRLYLTLKESD